MYDPDMASCICVEIASGRSLRDICSKGGMPDKATVFRLLAAHEDFRDQYARARTAQMDAFADDIIDIADDSGLDVTLDAESQQLRVDGEAIQRAKLRVDTRKWIMSKMAPKKYGEKLELEHGVTEGFGQFLERIAQNGKRLMGNGSSSD